jgi:hypothetical protein
MNSESRGGLSEEKFALPTIDYAPCPRLHNANGGRDGLGGFGHWGHRSGKGLPKGTPSLIQPFMHRQQRSLTASQATARQRQ